MKRQAKHLYLNKHGVYYFRRRIPTHLQEKLSCTEIKISLKTGNKMLALYKKEHYSAHFEFYLEKLTHEMTTQPNTELPIKCWDGNHTFRLSLEDASNQLEGLYTLKEHYLTTSDKSHFLPKGHDDLFLSDPKSKTLADKNQAVVLKTINERITAIENGIQFKTEALSKIKKLQDLMSTPCNLPHNYIETGTSQQVQPAQPVAPSNSLSLAELIDEYQRWQLKDNKWTQLTAKQNKPKLKLLIDITGNIETNQVDRTIARTVCETLTKLPKNMNRDPSLKGLSVLEIAKRKHAECKSIKTTNNHIDQYKALFSWAITEGHYKGSNPFEKLRIREKTKASDKRDLFTKLELEAIFNHPVFTNYGTGQHDEPCRYWGTLIGATTGARINEIMCLETKNVYFGETPYIHITVEEESETTLEIDKSVKNQTSVREVPIHPKLLELGFQEYVESLEKKGEQLLFPEIRNYKGRPGDKLGYWFNNTLKKHVGIVASPQMKVFHSFRHTIATELYEIGIDDKAIEQLTGHSPGHASEAKKTYTHPSIEGLRTKLLKGDFSFLDDVQAYYLKDRAGM